MKPGEKEGQDLGLYLDGLLRGAELAEFERRIAQDPSLAEEVERHRAVEGRLKTAFAPPGDVREMARRAVARAEPPPGPLPLDRLRAIGRLAAAAMILVALGGGIWWVTLPAVGPGEKGPIVSEDQEPSEDETVTLAKIYEEAAIELDERVFCVSDSQLAPHFAKEYGQKLCVKVRPDVPIQGPIPCRSWCTSWPSVTVLTGDVEKQRVLVLVDSKASNTPAPTLDPEDPYNLYSRDLGDLVLYELSPLPESRLLDLFYDCP